MQNFVETVQNRWIFKGHLFTEDTGLTESIFSYLANVACLCKSSMEHSRFGNIRSKRWPCPTPDRSARWQSSNWLDHKPTASICITRLTIFCLGDFWWSAFRQGPLGCCDDQMTFSDQHGSLQSALCPCQLEICEIFATASWKTCPKPLPIPKNRWFKLGSASYNDGLRILQLGMYSKLGAASCCIRRDTRQGTISQQPQEPFDKGISHVFWEWCHLRTWQNLAGIIFFFEMFINMFCVSIQCLEAL